MPVTIRSLLTARPLVVPLTTGASLRLSPGQVSDELADVEVADNAKVEKLREQGLIEVSGTDDGTVDAADEADDAEDKPPARSRRQTKR